MTVLFAFATGVVFTPWYISAAIFAAALLGTIIIFNPVRGAHLLILLVPGYVLSGNTRAYFLGDEAAMTGGAESSIKISRARTARKIRPTV